MAAEKLFLDPRPDLSAIKSDRSRAAAVETRLLDEASDEMVNERILLPIRTANVLVAFSRWRFWLESILGRSRRVGKSRLRKDTVYWRSRVVRVVSQGVRK